MHLIFCADLLNPTHLDDTFAEEVRTASVSGLPYHLISFEALVEEGVWMIVELGDGQVSGLPERADVAAFYRGLAERMISRA